MKKLSIAILTILSVACVSAEAATNKQDLRICPFQDNFSIFYGTYITGISVQGYLAVNQQSPTQFSTSCPNNASTSDNAGTVTLNVTNGIGSCQLQIEDGPWMMNPIVTSSSCSNGIQYSGMDHSWGTYSYTLNFAPQSKSK